MKENDFQKLADNINILMARKRINAFELSRQTGLPSTTIKRYRNNANVNPTLASLLPIAKFFSLTVSQLIGEDPIALHGEIFIGSHENSISHIPLLNWQDMSSLDQIDYSSAANKISTECSVTKKAFALCIDDDDCEFLPKNSLIIVDPGTSTQSGDIVIVMKEDERANLKKLIIDNEVSYLKSLIKGVEAVQLQPKYKLIGVVLQAKLEFRK